MRLATILFAGIIVVGQAVFAVGAFQNHFGTMEGARFIFGIGGESLAVAQNTYAVAWFKEKEINMVFGFQLAVARAGSSVNFWTVRERNICFWGLIIDLKDLKPLPGWPHLPLAPQPLPH